MTDQLVDEVEEKQREPEEAPLFDPKARGAALRAAFLKAAHPDPAPETEAEPRPETEPEAEPESKSQSNIENKPNDGANDVDPTTPGQTEPDTSSDISEEAEVAQEPKPAEESAEEHAEVEPPNEDSEPRIQDGVVTEQDETTAELDEEPNEDSLADSAPVAKSEHEGNEEDPEKQDIKPQIEKELFAEYVVFDEEEQPDGEPVSLSEDDEAENVHRSSEPQHDEAPGEVELPKGTTSPVVENNKKPVPAPVPIIEEVKATVIEEPTPEPENNQVVVKPQKLGFFARLKLLFFGGKRK